MPLMFGVFGFFFPSGLVLYWTTSNAWQIGQQYFMLRSRPTAEQLAERARENQKSKKKGFLSSLTDRAQQERQRQPGGGRPRPSAQDGVSARRRADGRPAREEPAWEGQPGRGPGRAS
jgi:YidC/Oxa1 family membrane protein insertase